MDQEITISVKNKMAETDFSEVVSRNGVYRLKFRLDEEWEEFPARVAVVMWAGGAAEKLFTGTECVMPQIESAESDYVLIGIYSRLGARRVASTFVRLRCDSGTPEILQQKPVLTLHEQVLSFLNEKDWSVFEEKIAEGVYSAVRVDPMGFVTEGWNVVEVGEEGAETPSEKLSAGGIFFKRKEGAYTPCYYDGERLEPLKLEGSGVASVNGKTGEITVDAASLGLADVATSGSYNDLTDKPEFSSAVTSVNGKTGEVTVDADSLGLAAVATSGNYSDLVGAPESGVYSVNGLTGAVTLDRESLGLGALAAKDKVQVGDLSTACVLSANLGMHTVTSLNIADENVIGRTIAAGAVSGEKIDENAISGGKNIAVSRDESGNFIVSAELSTGVTSVNGQTGEVTLDRESLGLGALAAKDKVQAGDLATGCVTSANLGLYTVTSTNLGQGSVNTRALATGAVTGAKLGENVIKAGENISVTRDEENNFIVSAAASAAGVSSVNGQTGEVVVSKETLGLEHVTSDRQMPLSAEVQTGVNFNELLKSGFYNLCGTEEQSCTNHPLSVENPSGKNCKWFLLVIASDDGSLCTQIAFSARKDGSVRIRTLADGAWMTWAVVCA